MNSPNVILKVKWHQVASQGGHPKSIGGLLDYVHTHDQHKGYDKVDDAEGLLGYIAWRDRAVPEHRLFDASGTVHEKERDALGAYIERSVEGLDNAPGARAPQNRKAFYHLIISPEDARGVDLRQMTRTVMRQLEKDAGTGGLPPWIAAEHRNTKHPHVHLVLAAHRQLESGNFRRLDITQPRLARMYEVLQGEVERQQHGHLQLRSSVLRTVEAASLSPLRTRESSSASNDRVLDSGPRLFDILAWSEGGHQMKRPRSAAERVSAQAAHIAGRLARQYHREAERVARERGWSSAEEERQQRLGRERAA